MSSPPTRSRTVLSLAITFVLFISPFLAQAEPSNGRASDEKGPVDLYLNDGANGDLVATSVRKETTEQLTIVGSQQPVPPVPVGRWSTPQLKFPISISGPFNAVLWADSQKGAKNAYFIIDVFKGSTAIARFNTTKQGLNMNPVRYDISGNLAAELGAGDILSVTVYFYADWVVNPGSIIPTPAQATFLFGGGQYTSGITITTMPVRVSVLEPAVEDGVDYIIFSAKVKDALDADASKMYFNMTIQPPAGCEVKHTTTADVRKTEDGLVFRVDWNYTQDEAADGDFIITMTTSYDGNRSFSNSSTVYIKVPHKQVTQIGETPMRPLILGSVGFGMVFLIAAVYINRRSIFKKRYAKKDGHKATTKKTDAKR